MKKGQTYGEGSVYYNDSKGRWVGTYSLGKGPDGKRKRKTVYGRTKLEVKQKLKQVSVDIYTGTFLDNSDITIYHLAKQMIDDKHNLGKTKDATYYRSLETLKGLSEIYNSPIQSCTVTQIKRFLLNEISYSQSVINKEFEMLRKVFAEAEKRGIINKNLMLDIEKPHSKQKKIAVRGLNLDERKKLVKVLKENDIKYGNQMLLSLYTGMRMGEVNALKVTDVNFTFKCISICRTVSIGEKGRAVISETTKTEAGKRTIPITAEVKEILEDAIGEKESGYIFTRKDGSPISTSVVKNQFFRLRKKYAIIDDTVDGKVDLHSLRHTYATMCIEAGMQPNVLQKLLGHTDIRVTMDTYADVFDVYRDNEIQKLSDYLKKIDLASNSNAKSETSAGDSEEALKNA